jgi:FkbM family methyltransferase
MAALARRWSLNQHGGAKARMSRWRVLHWMVLQKLGINIWVRAPLFFRERMWVLTGETISHGLLGFGYAEAALTALMLEAIKPGMRVVDIGAHLGYEAMLASVLVGEQGRVISFEPQPRIAAWAARNLERFPQSRLIESAVGESCGRMDFFELNVLSSAFSGRAATTAGRQTQVFVTTLADALREVERPVDFIKCDVEGGEMSVLRGAEDLLRRDQPLLVLEADMPQKASRRARIDEFSEFLSPLGYTSFIFEYDGRLKTGSLDAFDIGHANIGFAPASRSEFQFLRTA